MKYRIVELGNGKYKNQYKKSFFEKWRYFTQIYENAEDAKKELLRNYLDYDIKRIVEVIE